MQIQIGALPSLEDMGLEIREIKPLPDLKRRGMSPLPQHHQADPLLQGLHIGREVGAATPSALDTYHQLNYQKILKLHQKMENTKQQAWMHNQSSSTPQGQAPNKRIGGKNYPHVTIDDLIADNLASPASTPFHNADPTSNNLDEALQLAQHAILKQQPIDD